MARNCNMRFMHRNLNTTGLHDDAKVYVSSELALFPARNTAKADRNLVWRPSGHFEITDANNKIYINDGSDKTATIANGNYATGPDLVTAMTTALNAVSTGWIVAYSPNPSVTQYKFSFAHASAHTVRLSETTDAVWDTIGFTTSVDLVISGAITGDQPRIHTDEWIVWDFGSPVSAEYFGAIAELDEVFRISAGATIQLQGNNASPTYWTSPPLDRTPERTGRGLNLFNDDLADISFRYWRFRWVDRMNTTVGPNGFRIGTIYIGEYDTIEGTNLSSGFTAASADPSIPFESDRGNMFFDTRPKYDTFSGAATLTNEADRLILEQLYADVGIEEAFFFSIDPTLAVSGELADMTRYVRFTGQQQRPHRFRSRFDNRFQLREAV